MDSVDAFSTKHLFAEHPQGLYVLTLLDASSKCNLSARCVVGLIIGKGGGAKGVCMYLKTMSVQAHPDHGL